MFFDFFFFYNFVIYFPTDQVYWSKDVVFLVTDHEQLGAEAWLRAYHGEENNDVLDVGEMKGRGGAIQVMEMHRMF